MSGGYIVLTCKYHKEENKWIAICEELGTSTYGRTLNEAEKRLDEAIELHLETLEKVGETERFFKENNIKLHITKPQGSFPVYVKASSHDFIRPCIHTIRELSPA